MAECLTFVAQKVNRIRWKPTSSTLQKSETFATGSCEDAYNSVTLWDTSHMSKSSENHHHMEIHFLGKNQPRPLSSHNVAGDVNGMQFINSDMLVIGQSSGSVSLLKAVNSQELRECFVWEKLHSKLGGGCTDVAASLPDIASVGEDGTLHIIREENKRPLKTVGGADSCPMTCVRWLNSHDVCTCNTVGQLRVWDARAPNTRAVRVLLSSESPLALHAADRHPSRNHVIATGGADGCVTFFDVRMESGAVSKLKVHDADVWEVRFHPTQPDLLYTCSHDGTVRCLDTAPNLRGSRNAAASSQQQPIEVNEVLSACGASVNSLDVGDSQLVCATDAEQVYLLNDGSAA